MSMTAIIGALVALLPGAKSKTFDKLDTLVDQIEYDRLKGELADANRDLAIQRELTKHWQVAAQTAVRRSRAEREVFDRQLQRAVLQQYNSLQQQYAQQAQAAQAQAAQMQQGLAQLGTQQQNAFQYGDWCNCVPGRTQVFEAAARRQWGEYVDPAGDRIAQNRP